MHPLTPDVDADAPAAGPMARGWQRVVLALVAIEFFVLMAPTLVWLYERWTLSVWHNAHGLFVPPLAAYLAYQELKPLARRPARSSAWGFAWLLPALLLHAVDAGMHTQLLSAVALLLSLPGLSLLVLGAERTRAIAFPLVFLLFALPIPLGFTEQLHWQLRQVAAGGTAWLMPWLGVPVLLEGTTLHLPNGALEIVDACSGFSTLYAALAVACLTAYTAASGPRRLVVMASAVPLAIGANLLRVSGLALLVSLYGAEVLETFLHPLSGMLTFALALPVIFWLGGAPPARAEAA